MKQKLFKYQKAVLIVITVIIILVSPNKLFAQRASNVHHIASFDYHLDEELYSMVGLAAYVNDGAENYYITANFKPKNNCEIIVKTLGSETEVTATDSYYRQRSVEGDILFRGDNEKITLRIKNNKLDLRVDVDAFKLNLNATSLNVPHDWNENFDPNVAITDYKYYEGTDYAATIDGDIKIGSGTKNNVTGKGVYISCYFGNPLLIVNEKREMVYLISDNYVIYFFDIYDRKNAEVFKLSDLSSTKINDYTITYSADDAYGFPTQINGSLSNETLDISFSSTNRVYAEDYITFNIGGKSVDFDGLIFNLDSGSVTEGAVANNMGSGIIMSSMRE